MATVTLLPQSGLVSRTGANLQGQNGITLSSAPTTGVNSPASYVQDGITAPNDLTFWSNTIIGAPNTKSNFYVPVDRMTLSPSGLVLKVRGRTPTGGGNSFELKDFEVWMKKEHNPSLSADIQVASGLSVITVNTNNSITDYSSTLRIIEANRAAFESGIPAYLSVSGNFNFIVPVASGSYNIYEMELELSGNLPNIFGSFDMYIAGSESSSGNFDLYTFNSENSSGNFDLYISGFSNSSGNFDLYMSGPNESSGNFDLYILSIGDSSGNFDAYMAGSLPSSGSFDLYTLSIANASGSMNLVTFGPIGVETSGTFIPLSIWSEANSGIFQTVDLVLWNQSTFDPMNVMNLVTQGPEAYSKTGSLNLVLSSDPSITHQFDLFLANYYTATSGWIPLYITTPSGVDGTTPSSGTLNLVIGRSQESTSEWLPLFLQVGGDGSGEFPMYIYGNTIGESSVPLNIVGAISQTNSMPLFSAGF